MIDDPFPDDPLRSKLLKDAIEYFRGDRPVLIDETANPEDACWCITPDHEVVNAWLYGHSGLQPISPAEYSTYHELHRNSDGHPYILFSFHVSPDRMRVTYSSMLGPLAGHGGAWLVGDDGVTLTPDPDRGRWIS